MKQNSSRFAMPSKPTPMLSLLGLSEKLVSTMLMLFPLEKSTKHLLVVTHHPTSCIHKTSLHLRKWTMPSKWE
jgi:hypothetical protein